MPEQLIRLVTMTFEEDGVERFLRMFDVASPKIRAFPGCRHLELLRDVDRPNVFTTRSIWDSVERLEAYRASPLFEETWAATRILFADTPVAASYTVFRSADYVRTDE